MRCYEDLLIKCAQSRKTVIISGHSNTLPNLIKLFGVDDEITIEDNQYGDLFMIQWLNGLPTLTITQVGE